MFITLILIASGLLRAYNNTAIALWHDEAFSALYMRYPWQEMMLRIGLDVHPPLYYLILRLWTSFAGDSLLSLRLLSILFGVLTVWAGYAFIKAAFQNRKLALLAALFLALNPFHIQYALEARMYTLGTFLILWSSYFLVKGLESANSKKYWVGYALTVAAALYTHYYLLFSVAAQGLYVLLYFLRYREIKKFVAAITAYILAAALYIPWIPTLLEQVKRVEKSYWIPPMTVWSVPGTVWKMMFGGDGVRNSLLLIATLVALYLSYYFLKRVSSFSKWLIFLSMVVPLALAIAVSFKSNLYLDRYFVFSSLYFTILVAIALHYVPKFYLRWLLISLFLAAMLYSFSSNWKKVDAKNKPGMAAASQITNLNAKPGDKIYVGSSFIYFTFKYYNHTGIAPRLISDRPLGEIPHFSGTAILTDRDLILDYQKTAKNSTVWLLWTTGFGGSRPAIPKTWQELQEQKFPDTPGFKGEIFVDKYKVN